MPDRDPQAETMSAEQPAPQGKPRLRAVGSEDDPPTVAADARRIAEDLGEAAARARADSIAELAADLRGVRSELSAERSRADALEREARDSADVLAASERKAREAAAAKRMADRKVREAEIAIADLESDRSDLRARVSRIESERTEVIEAAVAEEARLIRRRAREIAERKIDENREMLRERAETKLRAAASRLK